MHVLLTALNITIQKPIPKTYDLFQWRILFMSMVQESSVTLEHSGQSFADFPDYDCDLARLSVDELKKLLDRCRTAANRLIERMQLADDNMSMIARLHSGIDLSLGTVIERLKKDSNSYQVCLQTTRHMQDTSDTELKKSLFERIQGLESQKNQLQHQKTYTSLLLQTGFKIHDRMISDLETQQLDFDEKVLPVVQSLKSNMSWSTSRHLQ